MTGTPTEVATAAAQRFRVLRERADAKHAKARSAATALRARVQRESREMMAEAKRRKEGGENPLVSPWPDEQKVTRYEFDDRPDGPDDTAATAEPPPRRARPAPADRPDPDDDDDNMSQVDTWLR